MTVRLLCLDFFLVSFCPPLINLTIPEKKKKKKKEQPAGCCNLAWLGSGLQGVLSDQGGSGLVKVSGPIHSNGGSSPAAPLPSRHPLKAVAARVRSPTCRPFHER